MPTDRKYARILHHVRSVPWAIEMQRLIDIMEVLAFQADGGKLSPAEVAAYIDVEAARKPRSRTEGAIAVLGLRGIIEHRIEQVDDISGPGGTSVQGFRQRFREAMSNDAVGAIVIDVDSPGGSVVGVDELASEIYEARGLKPIVAIANTTAASAAYYIASQADELVATPSAQVGSIGVFTAHRDLSKMLETKGETVTLVHAGKHKVDGSPFAPLSDEARAHMQDLVDGYYADFVSAVARGRGVKVSDVRAGYGEGRAVRADAALRLGMIDRVETFDQLINRLRGTSPAGPKAWAPTHPVEVQFLT